MVNKLTNAALIVAFLAGAPLQAQSIQDELHTELEGTLDNLIALAEAFPADLYNWSPTEEIRSFSEQLVHAGAASYFFASMVGIEMPEGLDLQNAEANVTSKEDVVAFLQAAKDHVLPAIGDVSDEALAAGVEWFDGSTQTGLRVMLVFARHCAEHLGQLITYARLNGVTPPWSQ